MEKSSGVLSPNVEVDRRPLPRLRLLHELEPRHRVFFRNLTDLLLRRPLPRVVTTSRPAPFWPDVFVDSRAPWSSFLESMLWHTLLVVAVVWGLSPVWKQGTLSPEARIVRNSSITYYKPTAHSFPAVRSSRPRGAGRATGQPEAAAHPRPIAVTPQSKPALVTPPDIKQALAKLPDVVAPNSVAPMVPFSAVKRSQLTSSSPLASAVAPAPQLGSAEARRLGMPQMGLPQASAVAPAPELGGASARRLSGGTNAAVVGPAPSVSGLAANRGNVSIGRSQVVQPAPQLPMSERHVVSGAAQAGLGGQGTSVVPPAPNVGGSGVRQGTPGGSLSTAGTHIVPPPPSVLAAGTPSGTGRSNSMSVAGPQAVPPPPSVQGARNSVAGGARVASLPGNGSQVVPPAPSISGSAGSGGRGPANSLAAGGVAAVPPPPSVQGGGNSVAAGGRGSSLPLGNGPQVVPPAPSIQGATGTAEREQGNSMDSLSAAGTQVVPPPPSIQGNDSMAGGTAAAMDPPPAIAAQAPAAVAAEKQNAPTTVELPVGLIGLVFALPGSSYFSNYEVFVAKRRLGQDQLQFIKLVYQFLPYQRRLSEYGLSNAPRIIKLRVTRDPGCDETLGQMLKPYEDKTQPEVSYPDLPPALRSFDQNLTLQCYRTTADDYRKAVEKSH